MPNLCSDLQVVVSADQASFNVGAEEWAELHPDPVVVSADQASFNVGAKLSIKKDTSGQ